jgi:hypothetical protein
MLIAFGRDKETKRTVRFTSPIGKEVSGSIYVQKDSPLAQRQTITVEICETTLALAQDPTD